MDHAVASTTPAASNFRDGLGERRRVVQASGETIELLCLSRQLTAVPSFEFALRERASRLGYHPPSSAPRRGYHPRLYITPPMVRWEQISLQRGGGAPVVFRGGSKSENDVALTGCLVNKSDDEAHFLVIWNGLTLVPSGWMRNDPFRHSSRKSGDGAKICRRNPRRLFYWPSIL